MKQFYVVSLVFIALGNACGVVHLSSKMSSQNYEMQSKIDRIERTTSKIETTISDIDRKSGTIEFVSWQIYKNMCRK